MLHRAWHLRVIRRKLKTKFLVWIVKFEGNDLLLGRTLGRCINKCFRLLFASADFVFNDGALHF